MNLQFRISDRPAAVTASGRPPRGGWPGWLAVLWLAGAGPVAGAPVHLVSQPPVAVTRVAPEVALVDFGRVAFGNLELHPPATAAGSVVVCLGEDLVQGRVNRHPPGSVRFAQFTVPLSGRATVIAAPPADQRNTTGPGAVRTPPDWGVVLPFRWVEIQGWPGPLAPVRVAWRRRDAFTLTLRLPAGMRAQVQLPGPAPARVLLNDQPVAARRLDGGWSLAADVTGTARIEVQPDPPATR